MPGFPVLHYVLEFVQTYVHWIGNAIQPSHLLQPSSLFAFKSFPASGSFPISWPSIGASTSALVPPMSIQGWFLLGLTGWISLQSKGLSRVFPNTTVGVWHQTILWCSALMMVQRSHLYTTTGKTIAFTIRTFVGKVIFLLFHTVSRFVTAFLPKSKHLWVSCCSHHPQWFWSPRR